jgi:hypothetical protein
MRKSPARIAVLAAFAAATMLGVGTANAAVGDSPGTDISPTPSPAAATSATADAQAHVIVDGSISLALDPQDSSFTLESGVNSTATGPDNSVSYVVTTNNGAGYTVSLKSDQPALLPADTSTNKDSIDFNAITATGTAATGTLPNNGTSAGGTTALKTGGTVYSQTSRSDATGDEHKTTFAASIGFLNDGVYNGSVTFTATAN